MDKKEKLIFIDELAREVVREAKMMIENDKIPDNWDGIELRWYLAEKFDGACFNSDQKKRKRDYNNTVLVENL